jgi:hypothetical protein
MANRFELGCRAWPILISWAKLKEPHTYEDLSRKLGYRTPKVSRAALWSIQDYCKEKGLPPLTSIIVNKHTGQPGSGFQWDGTLDDAQQRAFSYDWSKEKVPFMLVPQTQSQRKSSSVRTRTPTSFSVGDQEVQANGRGPYQERFRKILMKVYGRQCTLCDTRHPDFLVASHIVPWAVDSKNRLNPRNGILFCRVHDAAFEGGIVRIAYDLTVKVMPTPVSILGKDLHAVLKMTRNRIRYQIPKWKPEQRFLESRIKQWEE